MPHLDRLLKVLAPARAPTTPSYHQIPGLVSFITKIGIYLIYFYGLLRSEFVAKIKLFKVFSLQNFDL